MQLPVTTMQVTLRMLRTLHGALMIPIVLYVVFMQLVPAPSSPPLSPAFFSALLILSMSLLGIGQWMRSKNLRLAFETLRTKRDDAGALVRWRRGVIISDCLAEAVVLYGFVVHLLGGTSLQVAPFFIAGATAMLAW